jgi:hypothetical protein
MATKETTTCYKCETEIVAEVGQVHPLCESCDESFEDWFAEQLRMF